LEKVKTENVNGAGVVGAVAFAESLWGLPGLREGAQGRGEGKTGQGGLTLR
jgi:hypothetical protein